MLTGTEVPGICVGIVLLGGAMDYIWKKYGRPHAGVVLTEGEVKIMASLRREQQEMTDISDGVAEMLDKLVAQKRLTPAKAKKWANNFGVMLELKDLLPKKDPETIKTLIQRRLAQLRKVGPAPLPDNVVVLDTAKPKPNKKEFKLHSQSA